MPNRRLTFCAERHEADGTYVEYIEAADMAEAEAMAQENGWTFLGGPVIQIPMSEAFGIADANAMIDQLNKGGLN